MSRQVVGFVAASMFAGAATPAYAICPAELIPNAMYGRIDATAVALLEPLLVDMVPPQFAVPPAAYTLMECYEPFEDTTVTPRNGLVNLTVQHTALALRDGAVELDMTLRAGGEADLALQICALPNADCHAAIAADVITVHARVEPSVSDCALHLPVTVLDIRVDPYATMVRVTDCGLYDDIWYLVYDWFRDTIINLVVDEIRAAMLTELPAWVETFTSDFVAQELTLMGLRLNAAIAGVWVDPSAVTMALAANVTPTAGAAACVPAGSNLSPQAPAMSVPALGSAQLAVAGSQPFLERALQAAWLGGLLCFDSAALGLDLGAALDALAPGATLDAKVRMVDAPRLAIAQQGVELTAKHLEADLTLTSSGGEPTFLKASAGATLSAALAIDHAQRALTLAFTSLRSSGLSLDYQSGALTFSQAAVTRLIENTVLPAFADNLGPLPVSTSLLVTAPVAFDLENVATMPEHLRADLRLWPIDPTDDVPPVTVVVQPPDLPSAADLTFDVASVDDRTPLAFMRHQVIVDGVWEDAPRAGTSILVTGLRGGEHHLRLAAVDLNDNMDATPLTLTVWVDDQAPEVAITRAPVGFFEETSAIIEVAVADDWTPKARLSLRYTAGVIQRAAAPDRVITSGVMHGSRVTLSELPEDEVIRVTITATDEAGNSADTSVAFVMSGKPSFDCAAAGAEVNLVVMLALLLGRHLRRRWR